MMTEGADPLSGGRTSRVISDARDRAVFRRRACWRKVRTCSGSAVQSSRSSGGGGAQWGFFFKISLRKFHAMFIMVPVIPVIMVRRLAGAHRDNGTVDIINDAIKWMRFVREIN